MTTPADSRGGATPPRPPAARPQQWFTLRPWQFDVTAATGLLRAAPRPARPLPVEAWARAYGLLSGGSPHMVFLLGPGPGFDPYYAMTTDLGEPVIIATLTGPDGELAGPLLIDGCHRLYKAARLSRAEIPALVLTAEETLAIRHDATVGPPRQPQAQPAQPARPARPAGTAPHPHHRPGDDHRC